MAEYTITLTDAEEKAMAYVAYSVQDWIDNAVKNRARQAINEIYNMETERMQNDDSIDSIPTDKNQVVLDANIVAMADQEVEELQRD
tara:strand:+ start:522 stop:782 length:261 start_codon:yes stop_codon:yes gene_type:complete